MLNKNKIYKIVGISTPEVIDKIRNNLPKCILDNLEITSSELNRIEFVNKGMTKVKAIELLLNKLDIDKENADIVTKNSNNEDGVYYAIKELLSKGSEGNE